MVKPGKVLVFVLLTAAMALAGCGESPAMPTSISTPTTQSTSTPPKTLNSSYRGEYIYSPNSEWAAEGSYDSGNLEIYANAHRANDFVFSYQLKYSEIFNDKSTGMLKPYYWSEDSRFIFFLASKTQDYKTDICWTPIGYTGLIKLDIINRSTKFIIGSKNAYVDYLLSTSPDRGKIVYSVIGNNPPSIEIMDDSMIFKTPISLDQEYTKVIDFLWSPDSMRLAVQMETCLGNDYPSSTFGIINLNDKPPVVKPLFYQTKIESSLFYWSDNDIITLKHSGLNDVYDDYDVKNNKFIDAWHMDYIFFP